MSRKNLASDEQRAEETAREFLDLELLSEEVKTDVVEHLEHREPVEALRVVLNHRRPESDRYE